MQFNKRELITALQQSIRLLLSIALSTVIAYVCHLYEYYWALITAVVVTQSRIVQTLELSKNRIVGTIVGGAAGLIAIALQKYIGWSTLLVFSIIIVPMTALVSWRPSMRLGMVTLIVVFLLPTPGLAFGKPIDRIFAIIVGVVASLIASYCVLKSQARNNAFLSAGSVFDKLHTLLHYALTSPIVWGEVETVNDAITDELRKLSDELTEARKEHPTLMLEHYDPALAHVFPVLRRLQSDAIFVARAMEEKENKLTEQFQSEIINFVTEKMNLFISFCDEQSNYSKPRVSTALESNSAACDIHPLLSQLKDHCPSIVYFTLEALLKDLVEGQRLVFQKQIKSDEI